MVDFDTIFTDKTHCVWYDSTI